MRKIPLLFLFIFCLSLIQGWAYGTNPVVATSWTTTTNPATARAGLSVYSISQINSLISGGSTNINVGTATYTNTTEIAGKINATETGIGTNTSHLVTTNNFSIATNTLWLVLSNADWNTGQSVISLSNSLTVVSNANLVTSNYARTGLIDLTNRFVWQGQSNTVFQATLTGLQTDSNFTTVSRLVSSNYVPFATLDTTTNTVWLTASNYTSDVSNYARAGLIEFTNLSVSLGTAAYSNSSAFVGTNAFVTTNALFQATLTGLQTGSNFVTATVTNGLLAATNGVAENLTISSGNGGGLTNVQSTNIVGGNLTLIGTNTAGYFVGNGSLLTGTLTNSISTTNGTLNWPDKPNVAWHWRKFFSKAYDGIYMGTNGIFANVMFTGDSMANTKSWALMFQLTNVLPISAVGLDAVSMDGTGIQGELGGNGLAYGSGGNRGGAFATDTNYNIVINGQLTYLPPGTTARFYPGPVFMQGTPWWNGQVLSVCTLTEPGGGTADVYAQQYGNGSPYYKLGSINASGVSITNAYWTNFYATNFTAWNLVVSNTSTSLVRLVGASFANTNQSGLGLWMTKRGGGSLYEGTNCLPNVFSNIYASLDLDLAFSEWKEGNPPGYVTAYSNSLEAARILWTNASPELNWCFIGTHNDRLENYTAQNLATWNFAKKYNFGYLDYNRVFLNWTNMDQADMTEAGVHGNFKGDMYGAMLASADLGFASLQHLLDRKNLEIKVPLYAFTKTNGLGSNSTFVGSTRIGVGSILTNAWLEGTNTIDSFVTKSSTTVTNAINNPTTFSQPFTYNNASSPIYRGSSGYIWTVNQNGTSTNRWSEYANGDSLYTYFENEGPAGTNISSMGQSNIVMRLQVSATNTIIFSVGQSPVTGGSATFSPRGVQNANFYSGLNKECYLGDNNRSWYILTGTLYPYSVTGKRVIGLRRGDIIGWGPTDTANDASTGGIMGTNSLGGLNGMIISAVGSSANNLTNFAAQSIYINTNAICPNPIGTGGWLWNSNSVLYWVTSSKTNLISDGRP
jgi:hypothetical protein